MLDAQEPSVHQAKRGACDAHRVLKHPAYGVVTLTNPQGRTTLFGSDVGHSSVMRVTVHRAELHRDLSRDWIHSTDPIVEFELSHAQFAEFITGVGRGDGTPCTLKHAPPEDVRPQALPRIKALETKHQTFRREIREMAERRLAVIEAEITRLGTLIESGKIGKTELREIHRNLRHNADSLPGSVEFVVKQAEEAFEKASADARIEVEAFIDHKARALGLQSIQDLARIEKKTDETSC